MVHLLFQVSTRGGVSEALYTGTYDSRYNLNEVYKDMDSSIDASYGLKNNVLKDSTNNVNGNFGYGKIYSNKEVSTRSIKNIRMSVRTSGGDPTTMAFSTPSDISTINVNLDMWINSLKNRNTHDIVKFREDGLIPITDFIMERNLKDSYLKMMENPNQQMNKTMREPTFVIGIGRNNITNKWQIRVFLRTRSGTNLFLYERGNYDDMEMAVYNSQTDVMTLSDILPIKITGQAIDLNGEAFSKKYDLSSINIRQNKFNNFKYYIESNTNRLFLYSEQQKIAFTIYNDPRIPIMNGGLTIIEDYGLEDIIDLLPSSQIPPSRFLRDYIFYAF